MKIFLSWSGTRSRHVAEALKPWLKKVIQSADPWISVDMERGVKWLAEISKSLDDRTIGIFCVTPGNRDAPWLLFEAGAMSRHLGDEGRVIPYLLDFRSPSDLQAPLGQFNACVANEEGTWQLIHTLNEHSEHRLTDEALRETFDMWWPKLSTELSQIQAEVHTSSKPRRSDSDKLDDILAVVRNLERQDSRQDEVIAETKDKILQNEGILIRRAIAALAEEFGMDVLATRYKNRSVQLILRPESMAPTGDQVRLMSTIGRLHRTSSGPVHWVFGYEDDPTLSHLLRRKSGG